MTFKSDISAFKARVVDNVELAHKKIAFDAAENLMRLTPVDTGGAKGNWHVSIGRPDDFVSDSEDKSGRDTLSKIKREISGARVGDSIFVINNLPYITELENGRSDQAPLGMVALTVLKFKRIASKAASAALNKTIREF